MSILGWWLPFFTGDKKKTIKNVNTHSIWSCVGKSAFSSRNSMAHGNEQRHQMDCIQQKFPLYEPYKIDFYQKSLWINDAMIRMTHTPFWKYRISPEKRRRTPSGFLTTHGCVDRAKLRVAVAVPYVSYKRLCTIIHFNERIEIK